MKCPDLHILSSYQDGGLDERAAREVQEHLAACPECSARFRKLGKLGLFLRIGLGRPGKSPCLTAEELVTYLSGNISPHYRQRIENHLAGCQKCLHEVAVFSDSHFEQRDETSPVPTHQAMERFAQLEPTVCRVTWTRWISTHPARVAMAAAAALLVALTLPMVLPTRPVIVTRPVAATAPTDSPAGLKDEMTVLASLGGQGDNLASDHASLARFSRRMRLILLQTMEVAGSPSEDRVAMLKDDVLNSGLAEAVDSLSDEIKDARVQRYLADCRTVLSSIEKIDVSDGADELVALANDIQHTNLSELARLMELEGGGSLWLTASL